MREALDPVGMDDVWRENRPKARPRKPRSSA